MSIIIEDGAGSSAKAKVCSSENRLFTQAVTLSMEASRNINFGDSYNLVFQQTPTGANDCFLYIKNTSDENIIIEGVTLRAASNELIDVKLRDSGTPASGSTATPVNLNTGSGNEATGTFQTGNDITGLSGGSVAKRIYVAASNESTYYNFEQDIVLGQNGVFTLYAETGSIEIDGEVHFYYFAGC